MVGVYHRRHPEAYAVWVEAELPGETVLRLKGPEDLVPHLHEVEALLGWSMPESLMAQSTSLRLVHQMGAGVEDLAAMRLPERVHLARVVDQYGPAMAEYVVGHLLARRLHLAELAEAQRQHRWQPLPVRPLAGQRLGVAGLGSIGGAIVRLGHALGMEVWGYSRTGIHAPELPLAGHLTAAPGALAALAQRVDVLVLVMPLTPATRHAVDEPVLRALGPEGVLVNVGRGALVDEPALIRVLQEGALGGAILDVFETEPLPADSPLWDLPGVTITPHMAGRSDPRRVAQAFAENLRRLRRGEPLIGAVDRKRGY